MWEDDRNRRGGRWVINLNKSQRATMLDNFWLEVMLCLIGEACDEHSKYVSTYIIHKNFLKMQDYLKVVLSDKWSCCVYQS